MSDYSLHKDDTPKCEYCHVKMTWYGSGYACPKCDGTGHRDSMG